MPHPSLKFSAECERVLVLVRGIAGGEGPSEEAAFKADPFGFRLAIIRFSFFSSFLCTRLVLTHRGLYRFTTPPQSPHSPHPAGEWRSRRSRATSCLQVNLGGVLAEALLKGYSGKCHLQQGQNLRLPFLTRRTCLFGLFWI